jgi:creatinine amidohydrolase/Fe(II)-dependent formamide hydrolase-like protein
VHTAFFFSAPGSVHRATHSGTWGDAREATPEFGKRYLAAVTRGTLRLLDDIERTFAAMPPRTTV